MTELGNKIKTLRERRGLSRAELAHQLGVTTPAVHHLENGSRKPSLAMTVKLAAIFGASIEELALLTVESREVV